MKLLLIGRALGAVLCLVKCRRTCLPSWLTATVVWKNDRTKCLMLVPFLAGLRRLKILVSCCRRLNRSCLLGWCEFVRSVKCMCYSALCVLISRLRLVGRIRLLLWSVLSAGYLK